jgi:FkbM family methyltransferase
MISLLRQIKNRLFPNPNAISAKPLYSQGGEDIVLKTLFYNKWSKGRKGFFIDVGAYHPYEHSNTYLLYLEGWRGINIDPRPDSMTLFNQIRPEDINLEVGVAKEKGILTYYFISETSTMNSFSKENLVTTGMDKNITKEIPVEVLSLTDIMDKYAPDVEEIDFLTIDAEGMDLEILQSNNWDKYKPKVIIIEIEARELSDVYENPASKFLLELGYTPVTKNVILKNLASVVFVSDGFEY